MAIIDNFRYRSEIDGLRAVAVLVVIFFHANFGFPGGYIGVDVFFVISGFLITSLIWKDLERGSFTFGHFWERRARRIVPAQVVVTIATLVAGWFLLLPAEFRGLGKAAVAQAVFAANIHYWRDSGYFESAADEKPLLHTWSLAVEEQFYLIVPFLLWGVYRVVKTLSRTALVVLLAAAFIVSFGLSIYGVAYHPGATFYLLPTRAWELLLGSLIAFLPAAPWMFGRQFARECLAFAGMLLIFVPALYFTKTTPFPGLAALAPCLGAALVIVANAPTDQLRLTWVGRLLSLRPVVFIGLISYSLYLWHWPLLAISKYYLAPRALSIGDRIAIVAVGGLLGVLSWKYVETPFREKRLGTSRRAVFAYATTGLAAVFGIGLLCVAMQGFPQRLPPLALEFANAQNDSAFVHDTTLDEVRSGKLVRIGVADPRQPPTVMVWGDSHAMSALPAIDALLKEQGLTGRAATYSATAPVLDWYKLTIAGLRKDAVEYSDAVISYIQQEKIPHVILIARWNFYIDNTTKNNSRPFDPALLATVRQLVAAGCRPWILLDIPNHSFDVPTALSRASVSQLSLAEYCTKVSDAEEFDGIHAKIVAEIEAAGGCFLDPKPSFLDPTGQHYVVDAHGVALYRDRDHLSTKGARLMLLPLLQDKLQLKRR